VIQDVAVEPPVAEPAKLRPLRRELPLYCLIAALPPVLGLAVLHVWLHKGLSNYMPVLSDDLYYWHQIVSFSKVGFGNGYYTYQELMAPGITPYGFWGPMLPMLYGTAVAVVGVSYTVVVKLNMVVLAAAIVAALVITRPSRTRLLLVGLVLATATPTLFYLLGGMQETVHFAFAVLFAALFHRLLQTPAGRRAWPAAWLVTVIGFAALLRATWALLLVPAALALGWGNRRRMLGGVTVALVGAGALGLLFPLWSAPFPYDNLDRIRVAPGLGAKLTLLLGNMQTNVGILGTIATRYYQTSVVQRLEAVAILVLAVGLLIRAIRRRDQDSAALATVAGLAVLLPFVLVFALYDLGAGTRMIATNLLFVAVLAALSARVRVECALPLLLVVTNLATLSCFHNDVVTSVRYNYALGANPRTVAGFRAELAGHLTYQPGADRWCNTVLVANSNPFAYPVLAVPPGIGISVDLNQEFAGPLRSGYVLTTDAIRPKLPGGGAQLILLTNTSQGALYRNPASPCYQ
jgi:hypothetical protein